MSPYQPKMRLPIPRHPLGSSSIRTTLQTPSNFRLGMVTRTSIPMR